VETIKRQIRAAYGCLVADQSPVAYRLYAHSVCDVQRSCSYRWWRYISGMPLPFFTSFSLSYKKWAYSAYIRGITQRLCFRVRQHIIAFACIYGYCLSRPLSVIIITQLLSSTTHRTVAYNRCFVWGSHVGSSNCCLPIWSGGGQYPNFLPSPLSFSTLPTILRSLVLVFPFIPALTHSQQARGNHFSTGGGQKSHDTLIFTPPPVPPKIPVLCRVGR